VRQREYKIEKERIGTIKMVRVSLNINSLTLQKVIREYIIKFNGL